MVEQSQQSIPAKTRSLDAPHVRLLLPTHHLTIYGLVNDLKTVRP